MTSQLPAPAIGASSGSAAANGRHRRHLRSQDLVAVVDGLGHRLAANRLSSSPRDPMGHLGIDSDTALDVLRRWSSHTYLEVRELSRDLWSGDNLESVLATEFAQTLSSG